MKSLSNPSKQMLDCYVRVQGKASEESDEGVQGAYLIRVKLPAGASADALTDQHTSAIAKAMLDSFHEKQGIDVLDDFTIETYLENGQEIFELDGSELEQDPTGADQFAPTASHWGKIDDDDLPFTATQDKSKQDIPVPKV